MEAHCHPCTEGGLVSSGAIKVPPAERLCSNRENCTKYRKTFWPSFSVTSKSAHSNYMFCSALPLLSDFCFCAQYNTGLLLIPGMPCMYCSQILVSSFRGFDETPQTSPEYRVGTSCHTSPLKIAKKQGKCHTQSHHP